MNTLMAPVFVKADVSFDINEITLNFQNRNISLFGVSGLASSRLNPEEYVGKEVKAAIRLSAERQISFNTHATILSEKTTNTRSFGLKFRLNDLDRQKISSAVAKLGFYPTEYIRKYPRIPASSDIRTFPLRVIAHDLGGSEKPLIWEIANLSPNGVLLWSESPFAESIEPGARLSLELEPRGSFPARVRIEGLVCRISHDINYNGNDLRYLGVKFLKIDEDNRKIFMDLLKDVLERVKR